MPCTACDSLEARRNSLTPAARLPRSRRPDASRIETPRHCIQPPCFRVKLNGFASSRNGGLVGFAGHAAGEKDTEFRSKLGAYDQVISG